MRFVWIMGADNLANFDRWERWREIFTMVPVVVVDRPGWRLKALASKAARAFAASRLPESEAATLATRPAPAWTFLTGPLSHLSSTAIRNKAKAPRTTVPRKAQSQPELPWKKAKAASANGQAAPRQRSPRRSRRRLRRQALQRRALERASRQHLSSCRESSTRSGFACAGSAAALGPERTDRNRAQ